MLQMFPFPYFYNEKFVPELYIWNKITDHALVKFHKKAVYLCEYLEDGLSKNFKTQLLKIPKGLVSIILISLSVKPTTFEN